MDVPLSAHPPKSDTIASIGAPRRHNSSGVEDSDVPGQEVLRVKMRAELIGRVWELTSTDKVNMLVPPQGQDPLPTPDVFESIALSVRKNLENACIDFTTWKLPKEAPEKGFYDPFVGLLDTVMKALGTTLYHDDFVRFKDLWDKLDLFVYDWEVTDKVGKAPKLEPDGCGVPRDEDGVHSSLAWSAAERSRTWIAWTMDNNRPEPLDSIGWHENILALEGKANWKDLFSQAATYARSLFDSVYLLFVPIILFNQTEQTARVAIFSRGFTILTPKMNITTKDSFADFVTACIQVPRWTKASRNVHVSRLLTIPPSFKFDGVIATRCTVAGTDKRVSRFSLTGKENEKREEEPRLPPAEDFIAPRRRSVTRSSAAASSLQAIGSTTGATSSRRRRSLKRAVSLRSKLSQEMGPSNLSTFSLGETSRDSASKHYLERKTCFSTDETDFSTEENLPITVKSRDIAPKGNGGKNLVESFAWQLEARVEMELEVTQQSQDCFGLVHVILARKLDSTEIILPKWLMDIVQPSDIISGKKASTPEEVALGPEHRVLTQVLMQFYDRTLYRATGPLEIFIAIEHALIGMLKLFDYGEGYDQRDFSPWNILLSDKPDMTLRLPDLKLNDRFDVALKTRVFPRSKIEGCIGHIADFDHLVKVKRDGIDLARSQSGTWFFLSVRVARGWGTNVLQTIIDSLESSIWSLVWIILCHDHETPAALAWKAIIEAPTVEGKSELMKDGAAGWTNRDIPAALNPFREVLSRLFSHALEYGQRLDLIIGSVEPQDQLNLTADQSKQVIDLCRQAHVVYLIVYFDDERRNLIPKTFKTFPKKDAKTLRINPYHTWW